MTSKVQEDDASTSREDCSDLQQVSLHANRLVDSPLLSVASRSSTDTMGVVVSRRKHIQPTDRLPKQVRILCAAEQPLPLQLTCSAVTASLPG